MTTEEPKRPEELCWTMYGQLIRKKKRQDRLILAIHELHNNDNDHNDHHHDDDEEDTEEEAVHNNIATNISIDRHHSYDFLYLFSIVKLQVRPVVSIKNNTDSDDDEKRHSSKTTTTSMPTTSLEAVTVELVQCAPDPSAVALVLQGINEGRFPLQVMGTLSSSSSPPGHSSSTTTTTTTNIIKSRQEAYDILNIHNHRARRIAIAGLVRLLQGKQAYKPPRMRNPHIKQVEFQVLEQLYEMGKSGNAGWHLLEPKETTFNNNNNNSIATSTSSTSTSIMSHRGDGDDMNKNSNNSKNHNHSFHQGIEHEEVQHQQRHLFVPAVTVAVGTATSAATTTTTTADNAPPQGGDGDEFKSASATSTTMPPLPLPLNLPDECLVGNHKVDTTNNHTPGTESTLTNTATTMMNRAERRGDRVDYILSKKLPQVRWMTQRVRQMHPTNNPPKHIVDVGGGRGDLATALALAFPTTLVTVVDKNQSSLNAAQEYARQLNCHSRMQFIHGDMVDFVQNDDDDDDDDSGNAGTGATTTTRIQKEGQPPVDLVVALHACGDLSDLALAFADKVNAAFVICPCCYTKRYNFPQFIPPWNKYCTPTAHCQTLGRLAELNDRPQVSRLAMKLINSMRLQSMKEHKTVQQQEQKKYKVGLEEYDSACSQRNLVLVGVR